MDDFVMVFTLKTIFSNKKMNHLASLSMWMKKQRYWYNGYYYSCMCDSEHLLVDYGYIKFWKKLFIKIKLSKY